MRIIHVAFLFFYTVSVDSFIHENKKENLSSIAKKTRQFPLGLTKHPRKIMRQWHKLITRKTNKDGTILPFTRRGVNLSKLRRRNVRQPYQREKRRVIPREHYRRLYSDETERESSTSMEMAEWKQEFDKDWLLLKQKAIAERNHNPGENVAMAAARPWATPCGDPNEHDWPWGTCVLATQCDGEYRIYRGDRLCGRSNLVCCSVQLTQHDMYQGLDMSFVRTSSSSSDAKSKKAVDSRERRRNKRRRERIRRYRKRRRQKKLIKRKIRIVVHQITKILHRAFRNTTWGRKSKMDDLKRKIKYLKKSFREKRKEAKLKFDLGIESIKKNLYVNLLDLNALNKHFLMNETVRNIVHSQNGSEFHLRTQMTKPNFAEYYSKGEKIPKDLVEQYGPQSKFAVDKLKYIKQIKTKQVEKKGLRTLSAEPIDDSEPLLYESLFNDDTLKDIKPTQLEADIPKETKQVQKKGLRSPIDIPESSLDQSLHDMPQLEGTSLINKTPSGPANYSDVETNVTDGLIPLRGSPTSSAMDPQMDTYDALEPEPMQNRTRRSERDLFSKRIKHPKKTKRKDYLEYDIEYGLLYI